MPPNSICHFVLTAACSAAGVPAFSLDVAQRYALCGFAASRTAIWTAAAQAGILAPAAPAGDLGNDAHEKPPICKDLIRICFPYHTLFVFFRQEGEPAAPPSCAGASELHLHPAGHVRCLDAFLLPGAGIDGDDAALPIVRFAQVLIAQRLPRAVEPEKCRARVHDLQRAGARAARSRFRADRIGPGACAPCVSRYDADEKPQTVPSSSRTRTRS